MISKQDVKKIAELSNLELTAEEEKKYQRELGNILDFIDMLKKIDVEGVEPLLGNTQLMDVMRSDKAKPCKQAKEIISRAPDKDGNYLKTKAIL